MDNVTRLKYLKAMGIDVWLPRTSDCGVDDMLPLSLVEKETEPKAEQPNYPLTDTPTVISVENDEWQKLQQDVATCQRCSLCATRSQTVFGSGNKNADWMLIGEAPGANEDREGKPFVGKAGLLLTEMLRAVGLTREQVFIANIIKCRPPENRDPKIDEVAACSEYLHRQIAVIQPKIILALGRIAAQNLLKTDQPIGKLRGAVHYLDKIPVVVIYHPAYLLRSLLEKRKAWVDLQMAMQVVQDIEK
jgi:DNA polymerase